MPTQILFLPGALGRTQMWERAANLLTHPAARVYFGWPGFGTTPADPRVNGIDDLVARVIERLDQPTAIVAQSMGGVIALRAALAKPEFVTHLVLTVTSGGLDITALGGADWRAAVQTAHPQLPRWFYDHHEDLSVHLSRITAPTLLLWGDADPISPVRVGERLADLLPNAALHVVSGGDHDLAETHASEISPLIDRHFLGTFRQR